MVLLVVDTQQLITNADLYQFQKLESRIMELIQQARKSGIEVIYTRHDDGSENELTKGKPGFHIHEPFMPMEGERVFDKTVNSPFLESGLLEYLREKKEDTIMVVGLQTEYCIDATVKCGFEHGFKMVVPEYTNSTFDNEYITAEMSYKYYNDFIWNGRYADCISFEDAMNLMK